VIVTFAFADEEEDRYCAVELPFVEGDIVVGHPVTAAIFVEN
jgi:hypothetical protein